MPVSCPGKLYSKNRKGPESVARAAIEIEKKARLSIFGITDEELNRGKDKII
ncbi:MAG: hypothetical protein ABC542_02175 [Candidatus Methanosuratincola petrocarbonis]